MNGKTLDLGLLVMRLGLGGLFIAHGQPKVWGGPDGWEKIGGAMAMFGLDFAPTFWGACAAFSEFLGGILLVLGLFFRPACAALAFTMLVALGFHLKMGHGFYTEHSWAAASHCLAAFLGLLLTGPGKFSVKK
jgi:putative oxidoreductase